MGFTNYIKENKNDVWESFNKVLQQYSEIYNINIVGDNITMEFNDVFDVYPDTVEDTGPIKTRPRNNVLFSTKKNKITIDKKAIKSFKEEKYGMSIEYNNLRMTFKGK